LPAGVTLTPSGDLVITQAGAVISGLDIKGTVTIEAPNVTLENCKIESGGFFLVNIKAGVTGAVVQNCEINGLGTSGSPGSCGIRARFSTTTSTMLKTAST
jgi:nitrous oxidase accessory protein NosD